MKLRSFSPRKIVWYANYTTMKNARYLNIAITSDERDTWLLELNVKFYIIVCTFLLQWWSKVSYIQRHAQAGMQVIHALLYQQCWQLCSIYQLDKNEVSYSNCFVLQKRNRSPAKHHINVLLNKRKHNFQGESRAAAEQQKTCTDSLLTDA